MRALVFASVSIVSWIGGGVAYWVALYWIWGERRIHRDLFVVGFWTFLLLLFCLPFHLRTVSILVGSRGNRWRRLATATVWGAAVAIGAAALLVALLGRGRVSGLLRPEGQLLLVWISVMTMIFAILGAMALRFGVWVGRGDEQRLRG